MKLEHFNNSGKIIARAIGPDAAYELLKQYGGQSFYIARQPTNKHVASKKLGLTVHKALSEMWPDQEFELPVVTYIEKRLRNENIIEDARHMCMRELVAKYQLTRYQIQVILRDKREDDPTPSQQQLKFSGF